MDIKERFERAIIVREMYPDFVDFCREAFRFLGFEMTWMQADIARYMQTCPRSAMVEAQRGEAKSTIACIFAVWTLTQEPSYRAMLVSGSEKKAAENGALIYRLITRWDEVSYLAPDRYEGDKTSLLEFDVHWSLKGIDKSASVVCLGLTGSLQGYRADLLIPDDIETTKNGLTATQRAHVELLSKEFRSICTQGQILYLGTPQTKDSIYNNLPARGFEVRVWPGRFPTEREMEHYGDHLAPSILERMQLLGDKCRSGGGLDGTRGWSTDPERYSESDLCEQELDKGPEIFQLQYMLDTTLSDAARMQIKLKDLIVANLNWEKVPEAVGWAAERQFRYDTPQNFPIFGAELYRPAYMSEHFAELGQRTMFIDPAGDGGDELAFAFGGVVGPYLHLVGAGGYRGGLADDNLEKLAELVKEFKIGRVLVEKNMGAGTPTKLILNYFKGNDSKGRQRVPGVSVEEVHKTGQKERRIIDTIRPVTQRHRLIVHQSAMDMDLELIKQYPADKRPVRSVFHQLHSITTDRGSLERDDRADALEGLVKELAGSLVIDEEKANEARRAKEFEDFRKDPMGSGVHKQTNRKRRRAPAALRRRGM